MDLIDIINSIPSSGKIGISVVLIILAGLIKIPKIELNIWEFLAEKFGALINKAISNSIQSLANDISNLDDNIVKLDAQLKQHLLESSQEKIKNTRQRILKFNDEIIQCKFHSLEHFEEIIQDIDAYEAYCMAHPEYPNNKANLAIKNIKESYTEEVKKQKIEHL